ncbi:unnamed protein product [Paramecium octaurelia]|uniref:Protein kinase domain containing protein n=1 Tax=Paramecium octaurelia TaxID=43137 RepID=A0A8S1S5U6_PAROT|nr:unnamed protein product [Paramecium octaurelia]
MGCLQPKKLNRIVAMQTTNKDLVFTSTADIHKLYSFGKVLGIGAFGKVLVAKMRNNNSKQYAIKMIDKRKVRGREAMLANEIYVLQKLDHPNIIKFYEVYQNELYFYIIMDYCEGGELVERIQKSQKNLSEGQVQNIIFKICSAIMYIHEQGIIHRDIKPENILFSTKDPNAEPKLIDFGLAIKFDSSNLKQLKAAVGTPLYLAPEVIEGKYNEKCDVWSLGILLFHLLCGYPPFYGKNRADLYENIQYQNLIFDRRHWNNVSDEAKDLIKKMLNKNPNIRPSAKDCLRHLWFRRKFQHPVKLQRGRTTIISMKSPQFEDQRSIYQMLKTYRIGAKFKKEVMKVLVNQMNEKELGRLKKVFQKIDVDNSGTITVQELKEALMEEGSHISHEEIEQLIQLVGFEVLEEDKEDNDCASTTKSSKQLVIKYSDFLAACIDERRVLTREKLWSVFKYFDTQDANFIMKEDIKEALARHGRQLSDEKIEEMIYEIDPNHDNKISFEEFCQMMGVAGVEQTMDFKDEIKEQLNFHQSQE